MPAVAVALIVNANLQNQPEKEFEQFHDSKSDAKSACERWKSNKYEEVKVSLEYSSISIWCKYSLESRKYYAYALLVKQENFGNSMKRCQRAKKKRENTFRKSNIDGRAVCGIYGKQPKVWEDNSLPGILRDLTAKKGRYRNTDHILYVVYQKNIMNFKY